jgi:hypothetical protein
VHTLADDLESFFHVLTWVALRYTAHALSSTKLTYTLTSTFDECYVDEGVIEGGQNKASSLVTKSIVTTAKFTNPMLSSLLSSLCGTLAVRYEEAPSEESIMEYHQDTVNFAGNRPMLHVLEKVPAARYLSRTRDLQTSDWMLKTFTDAIENRADWPADDKPVKHVLLEAQAGIKRKSVVSHHSTNRKRRRQRKKPAAVVEEKETEAEEEDWGGTEDDEG